MEKIVIGAPYEIIIEPSVDIGDFSAELIIELKDSHIGVSLKKIKGEENSYSFIIPSSLEKLFGKSEFEYKIFVYKENARFEVDSGKLTFIDEKDFKVKVRNKVKMKKIEEPEKEDESKEEKSTKKEKTPKATPKVEEAVDDPAAFAEKMIEKQLSSDPVIELLKEEEKTVEAAKEEPPSVVITETPRTTIQEHNLKQILSQIEERNQFKDKRKKINENIQKAIRKT